MSRVVTGLGCRYLEQDNQWLTQLLAKLGEHGGFIVSLVALIGNKILVEVSFLLIVFSRPNLISSGGIFFRYYTHYELFPSQK